MPKEKAAKLKIIAGASLLVLGVFLSLFIHGDNERSGSGITAIISIFGFICLAWGTHQLGRLGRPRSSE